MSDRGLRLAGYAACGLAAVAIVLLLRERGLGRDYASFDLSAYLSAARRLVAGEPLYPELAAASFRLGDPDLYLYPPPVALLFVPLLLLPFGVASALWGIVLTALAVVVAVAISRGVAPARRPLAVALVLGAFPLEWELANGNLTLVTLALALVALRARASAWSSAVPLAGAIGVKLIGVPVALYLALAGHTRIVVLAAIALAISCAVTVPFLSRDWIGWLALTARLTGGPTTQAQLLPGPLSAFPGRAVPVVAALGALAGAARLARSGRLAWTVASAIALAAAPFVSAFVFFPYLLFALPLVVVLVLGDGPPVARAAGTAAWLLFQVQGLDLSAPFPSGALGAAVAVAAGLATAPAPASSLRS